MIAIRIITALNESYNGRLIIKFGKHRIVLPNEEHKRIYLGKRRYRELINTSIIKEMPLNQTFEYHFHLPKRIKENLIITEPIKNQPVKEEIKVEIKKRKNLFKRLFGL
jgi:hypothetical protein